MLKRTDREWFDQLEHPYVTYPIHVSLSFLHSTTFASALYLVLLRFLARQYKQVVRLVDTIGTDSALTSEEQNICQSFMHTKNSPDMHPDATACRLKISVVMLDAPLSLPWNLSVEMASYLFRLQHVSAECLLTPDEELTLLRACICDIADKRFDKELHTPLGVMLCKNRRAALRARVHHSRRAVGPLPSCTIELPRRVSDARSNWVHKWHPTALTETPEALESMLAELIISFKFEQAMYMEGMLQTLGQLNAKNQRSDKAFTVQSGFLLLYCLFTNATKCRPGLVAAHWASSCSASFARLLLAFVDVEEPNLLNSFVLCLARCPALTNLLPEFVDTRVTKRRNVFSGVPTPEEPQTPLASVLRSMLTEIQAVVAEACPAKTEVLRTMRRRRSDVLSKERMWGSYGGGYGGYGGGYGGDSFGGGLGGVTGVGFGAAGGSSFGGDLSGAALRNSRLQASGFRGGGAAAGAAGGASGTDHQELDALAREVEEQTTNEIAELTRLSELRDLHREGSVCKDLPSHAVARLLQLQTSVFHGVLLEGCAAPELATLHASSTATAHCPLETDFRLRLPGASLETHKASISNHSCSSRELRAVLACTPLRYVPGCGFNDACPITLLDFEAGEGVTKLPGGHLISDDAYQELLRNARSERKLPVDPFTRQELPPSTDASEMHHFMSAPLQAIGLERFVTQLSRRQLGKEEVSSDLGFDSWVSSHPDARSKVARDMIERLRQDSRSFANSHNGSTVPRCVFVPADAQHLMCDPEPTARDEPIAQVSGLLTELLELREKDAATVRDNLRLLLKRVSAVQLEGAPREEQQQRQVFRLRQLAEQEVSASVDYVFCLLISSTAVADLRAMNPYISVEEATELLDRAVATIFHANRIGQINRCVHEARGLLSLLKPPEGDECGAAARREAGAALALKAQALAEQLLARRHYIKSHHTSEGAGDELIALASLGSYDPRFVLFECEPYRIEPRTTTPEHHHMRVQRRRPDVTRHSISRRAVTHNLVLRESQVQLIWEFVDAVRGGRPLVKQMLMGGGKTTVVGPMLSLILGNGETLVLQTMPQALLEQSKATLRATFSAVSPRRHPNAPL